MTEHTLTGQILGQTEDRTCVSIGCALCCKMPFIKFPDGYEKPAGSWCKHCAHPPTCDIYSDRPPVCRDFYCTWVGDPNWPKELDPKSTGCMLVTEHIETRNRKTNVKSMVALIRVHENRPGAVGKIDHALKVVWLQGEVAIAVYTPNGKLRLIGYDQQGQRVTFLETEANPFGITPNLPIITASELQRWRWDWRKLRARCALEQERIDAETERVSAARARTSEQEQD